MEEFIRTTDDIAGLQAHLGGKAALSYVDLRRQESLAKALGRWPLLATIHVARASASSKPTPDDAPPSA